MEEEESSAETQNQPHPGLVSQVELSFVALNLAEADISDSSLAKAKVAPGAEPVERKSLRGGQIKVRVKSFSLSQPPPSAEEEEEEIEQEEEAETDPETRAKSSSVRLTRELPPLSPQTNDEEEESFAASTLISRATTPRRLTAEENAEFEENLEEPEDDFMQEGEEEQDIPEVPEDDDALKSENSHSNLIEKECVVPEVIIVWEYVCKFITQKLLEGFAVRIPGLGTFSFLVFPSDIVQKPNAGNFSLRKTRKFPVFKICPHLKEMYGLIEENHLYQCNVPTVPLNKSVIAANAHLSPGIVDGIMIETLQSFVTGVITNKNLEFPFPFIGKLYIKQGNVFMIFYQQFCEGLSFEFNYAPSYITSVFPGNMTPLAYHRPSDQFHSVFHFCDVRSVEDKIAARPRPYAKGKLVRDSSVIEDPCEFEKHLFTHSNLLYDCSCCKSKQKSYNEDDQESYKGTSTPPCGYSKNYDRIKKACCTQHGSFSFQKPDGSTFSPEPLFKSSKTGNPILDRLADDRCLLQQAIGCWMKRKVVQTLGTETIAKHHDREYFRQKMKQNEKNGSRSGKNYLAQEPINSATEIITVSPSPSSVKRKSIKSKLSNASVGSTRKTSVASEVEEELFGDGEEENILLGEAKVPNRTSLNVKAVRSKSFRKSKDISVNLPQATDIEEKGQSENSRRVSREQRINSTEFEQNE